MGSNGGGSSIGGGNMGGGRSCGGNDGGGNGGGGTATRRAAAAALEAGSGISPVGIGVCCMLACAHVRQRVKSQAKQVKRLKPSFWMDEEKDGCSTNQEFFKQVLHSM